MKEKQTTTYVANDGKEFVSKSECEQYEKKLKSMQLWAVTHGPDCCEGRGYHNRTYLKTNAAHQAEVEDYLFKTIGNKSAYVQGVRNGYMPNWTLTKVDNDHVMRGATFGLSEGGFTVKELAWCNESKGLVEVSSER